MNAAKPIPVFISSPGDVAEERQRTIAVINRLNAEAEYQEKANLISVAWDIDGGSPAMEATETPQDTINQWIRRPSASAIVIVILWSRMGSPLPDKFRKPDDTPYLSGTEWEFEDARQGHDKSSHDPKLPRILVYRRTEKPLIELDDPKFDEKRTQYQRVQDFFKQFRGDDGIFKGGVNDYAKPDDFEKQVEMHLRQWRDRLKDSYDPGALDPEKRKEQEARATQQVINEAEREQNRRKTATYGKVINSLPQSDMVERFKDRVDQQTKIVNELKVGTPLISIYGQGGAGKTALVCKVLGDLQHDKMEQWDGLVYLGAGPQSSAPITLERIVLDLAKPLPTQHRESVEAAWRDPQVQPEQKVAVLFDQLKAAGGQYALLLDNLETHQDPDTGKLTDPGLCDFFKGLFECGGNGLRVLVTSRQQLNLRDLRRAAREVHISLEEGLPLADAIQLMVELDRDGRAGIGVAAQDPIQYKKLEFIVEKTGGFPRALEAVVMLLQQPTMTLADVVSSPALIDGEVRALIEEAIRRLDPDSLRVMEVLAVYGRPISQSGLEYLLAPYMDITDLRDILNRLVSHYFVGFNKATLVYSLHPIDREFCLARVPAGSKADTEDLFSEDVQPYTRYALLSRAAEYHRSQRQDKSTWKQIDNLQPHLLEFEYRVEMGDYDAAADLLLDIDGNYLMLWGYSLRVIDLHERLQGHIQQSWLAQSSIGNLGSAYYLTGRVSDAVRCYEQALSLARKDQHRQGEGVWLGGLGIAYRALGQVEQAIDYYQQALIIAREIGDRDSEGYRLGSLGNAYYALGQVEQAIDYYQQALAIAREIGHRDSEGYRLGYLGSAYYALGQVEQAIDCCEQALAIAREFGDRRGEGYWLGNLGEAYCTLGQAQQAIDDCQQAIHIGDDIKEPSLTQFAYCYLADALLLANDLQAARDAAAAAQAFDVVENNYSAEVRLGLAELRIGNAKQAKSAFEATVQAADQLLNQTPNLYGALYGCGLAHAGRVLTSGASLAPAIDDYRAAREICSAAGVVADQLWLLDELMKCPGGEVLDPVRAVLAGEA